MIPVAGSTRSSRRAPVRALLALGLAALTACAGGEAESIRLGLAGPFSQATGRSMELAARMAVEEINRSGGIDGRPLELVVRDDQANPEQAIAVASDLRDNSDVVAVIGHLNSAASLAAADIYNDDLRGVAAVSPASSSPRFSETGRWIFRVCPSDLQHGPALAGWIRENLRRDRTAVLYANDDYGRGVLDSFSQAYRDAGGQVITTDPFLPALIEDESELDPFIQRAITRNVDALVIAGQADEALTILRAAVIHQRIHQRVSSSCRGNGYS